MTDIWLINHMGRKIGGTVPLHLGPWLGIARLQLLRKLVLGAFRPRIVREEDRRIPSATLNPTEWLGLWLPSDLPFLGFLSDQQNGAQRVVRRIPQASRGSRTRTSAKLRPSAGTSASCLHQSRTWPRFSETIRDSDTDTDRTPVEKRTPLRSQI